MDTLLLMLRKLPFIPCMYVFEGCWKQIIIKVLFLIYLYIFVIFHHFKLKFTDNRGKKSFFAYLIRSCNKNIYFAKAL